MTTIGLRELRQSASDIVRRVEAGEEVIVTVAGRPAARLVPIEDRRWRTWDTIAPIFDGVDRGDLADELRTWRHDAVEGLVDPFERDA